MRTSNGCENGCRKGRRPWAQALRASPRLPAPRIPAARRAGDGARVLAAVAVLVAPLLLSTACAERELTLPAESELADLYGPAAEVRLDGNVIAVRVEQDATHLQRGGAIWARAGPYIFLFSPQTREIFQEYDGVAAVRVRTERGPRGEFIAEATLRRDTMTTVAWARAREKVTRARQEGTERPWYLEDLVRFGEDWASYEYAAPHQREATESDGR